MGPASRSRQPVAWRSWPLEASTGGPNTLAELLPSLPGDFPVPIVDRCSTCLLFTAMLAERLGSLSAIGVSEAVHGDRLGPGHAWIATW